MKTIFTFLFCNLWTFVIAQPNIRLFSESKKNGYILYAGNDDFCPVTLSLELNLTNLAFTQGQQKIFVIPAKTGRFKIGELDVLNQGEAYKYSYQSYYNYGDINIESYDTAYEYDLPYLKGKKFRVLQGYNGSFSHQGENALDFTMPEGTEILAARDGIVIKIVENNNQSCPLEECKKYGNYITVYHSDGTFADYGHIKYNGSKVKEGDHIKKGDTIAYSGNTGWSTTPHLHFACSLPGLEKRQTIMTKFRIDNGDTAVYLKARETYLKDY